ncbi:MAG TPA: hypothetical protein DIV40_06885, partial [Clostridiales bacterium]|nr:hypothetical protein [Clostridiales bacterium]
PLYNFCFVKSTKSASKNMQKKSFARLSMTSQWEGLCQDLIIQWYYSAVKRIFGYLYYTKACTSVLW